MAAELPLCLSSACDLPGLGCSRAPHAGRHVQTSSQLPRPAAPPRRSALVDHLVANHSGSLAAFRLAADAHITVANATFVNCARPLLSAPTRSLTLRNISLVNSTTTGADLTSDVLLIEGFTAVNTQGAPLDIGDKSASTSIRDVAFTNSSLGMTVGGSAIDMQAVQLHQTQVSQALPVRALPGYPHVLL